MSYDLEQTVECHRQTTDPLAGTRVRPEMVPGLRDRRAG